MLAAAESQLLLQRQQLLVCITMKNWILGEGDNNSLVLILTCFKAEWHIFQLTIGFGCRKKATTLTFVREVYELHCVMMILCSPPSWPQALKCFFQRYSDKYQPNINLTKWNTLSRSKDQKYGKKFLKR